MIDSDDRRQARRDHAEDPSNTKLSRSRPKYFNAAVKRKYDIERLDPCRIEGGKRKGFESRREAHEETERRIKILQAIDSSEASALARKLSRCLPGKECGSPACRWCMREFRRVATGLAIRALSKLGGLVLVTLALNSGSGAAGEGPGADLARVKHALRQRLRRAGLDGKVAIGGIEIDWHVRREAWDLHVHLIVAMEGSDLPSLEKLKPLRNSKLKRPVHRKRVKAGELASTCSYIIKFYPAAKGRRKRVLSGKGKVPLHGDRLAQALIWMDQYDPEDFVVLLGVRRDADRFNRLSRGA